MNPSSNQSNGSVDNRDEALRQCQLAGTGTVGESIGLLLGPITAVVRNFGAGNIGYVYSQRSDLLKKPNTDENVRAFCEYETKQFGQMKGLGGLLGRSFSAETRTNLVTGARDANSRFKTTGQPDLFGPHSAMRHFNPNQFARTMNPDAFQNE